MVGFQTKLLCEEFFNISDGEINLGKLDVDLADGLAHLVLTDRARVVRVYARESFLVVLQKLVIDEVDKHHQDLHLESLRGTKVLQAGEHLGAHCIDRKGLLRVDHP